MSGFQSSTSAADQNQFSFSSYMPAEPSQSDTRVKDIINIINNNQRKMIDLYAVLGAELAKIKYRYIKTVCTQCVRTNDVYRCITCTKNSDMKGFYEHIGGLTHYSRDYINFLIRISRMCHIYPKLLYVSVSTSDIKKNLKYIETEMEEDKQFWFL